MTVKELIEKLKVYNPDKEIFLTLDGREGFGMFALEVMPVECGCKDEQGNTFTETIVSILPRRRTDTISEGNPESASLSGEIVSPEEPQNAVTDTAIAQN